MLSLRAQIGDQVQVTFVWLESRDEIGVETQQRVNGRPVYLDDSQSGMVGVGDTCLVEIVGENEEKTHYFGKVVSVVRRGDGKGSLLDEALDWIYDRSGEIYRHDAQATAEKVVAMGRTYFGDDRLGLVEFLIDIIEFFAMKPAVRNCVLKDEFVSCSVEELIKESSLVEDHKRAAQECLRYGTHLKGLRRNFELVARCLKESLRRADQSADKALVLEVLSVIENACDEYSCLHVPDLLDYVTVVTRLIFAREQGGNVEVPRRLKLARINLLRKDASGARSLLEPVFPGLNWVDYCFGLGKQAARMMAESYVLEDDFEQTLAWQMKAGVKTAAEHKRVADAMIGLGRFAQAAFEYRKAFEVQTEEHLTAVDSR